MRLKISLLKKRETPSTSCALLVFWGGFGFFFVSDYHDGNFGTLHEGGEKNTITALAAAIVLIRNSRN